MNRSTFFISAAPILVAALAVAAGGCAERATPDRPINAEYVRPDGKIYTPPDARPDAPATAVTKRAGADRFGVVDSIQTVSPHVDNPNAIPGGDEVTPANASPGSPLPANAQATREIAKEREQAHERYQIRVRLPDGSYRTIFRESLDGLQVGDSIRVSAEGAAPN